MKEDIEEVELCVFPMKYIYIDFQGKDFYDWESDSTAFLIWYTTVPSYIK